MGRKLGLSVTLLPPAGEARASFREDPGTWLPAPLTPRRAGHWHVYLWAAQVGVLVDCAVGEADVAQRRVTRAITWSPLRGEHDTRLSRAVPAFAGRLSVIDRGDGMADLRLEGTYQPPGGRAGAFADRLVLRRVARHTARTFLHEIAERMEEPSRTLQR